MIPHTATLGLFGRLPSIFCAIQMLNAPFPSTGRDLPHALILGWVGLVQRPRDNVRLLLCLFRGAVENKNL